MDRKIVKHTWNKDSKFAIKLNKIIIWPLGIWPSDSDSVFSYFRFVLALSSQVWMVLTQGAAFFLRCGDVADLVDYIMMAVCAILSITKISAIRFHMSKVRSVFFGVLDDWSSVSDDKSRELAKPFVKTGRKVFFVQMINCYISNTLIIVGSLPFLMPPMDNETMGMNATDAVMPLRQLPLRTGCMFGNCRDGLYAFFYVYESVMINICANGNVGCDVFLFCLLMHLCGQIELLKADIVGIGRGKEKLEDTRARIVRCIQQHTRILYSTKALNDTVSGMLVVQLGLNALMYLMLGLRTIIALNSDVKATAARPIVAFVVIMIQLYLFSYASDRLSQQGESLVNAFYECNWYNLPLDLRKDLQFAMARANRPIYLMAGHFYTMSVENVMNILKATFSYFNILRVAFEGESFE